MSKSFSVQEVAESFRTGRGKVLGWIQRGELRAVDISAARGQRPRWRIFEEDLAAFVASRSSRPAAEPAPRRPRVETPAYV